MVESLLFSKRNEISWNIGTEFEVVKISFQIQDAFLQKCIENNVIYGFYFEQWYDTLHTVVIVSIFIPIIMLDSFVSLYKRYCNNIVKDTAFSEDKFIYCIEKKKNQSKMFYLILLII